jgi:flavin reductase (DIM6/NTAB) family NADH-FMN oxidoreductase RutF
MMLACLNRSAPTSLAVSSSGVFGVNILGHGHEHLAQQFAAPSDDKFRGVSLTPGVLGVPLLSDALAYLECRVVEQVTGGTHTIFLGKVVHASAHEGEPLALPRRLRTFSIWARRRGLPSGSAARPRKAVRRWRSDDHGRSGSRPRC